MSKKKDAIATINRIRDMPTESLNAWIVRDAGEELSRFFLEYASDLILRDPSRAAETACSLLLMGYLIRAAELPTFSQKEATA